MFQNYGYNRRKVSNVSLINSNHCWIRKNFYYIYPQKGMINVNILEFSFLIKKSFLERENKKITLIIIRNLIMIGPERFYHWQ